MIELGEKGKVIDKDLMVKDPRFGLPHFYGTKYDDQEHLWFPRDTRELYNKNMKSDYERKLLQENGWTSTNITYKINKNGFRHDGSARDFFKVNPGGVAYVGDSIIFGVGINIEDTFTYKAHPKELPYINMGCPGHGIEGYYRVVKKWLPIIRPKLLCVFHSWVQTRSEHFISNKNAFVHHTYQSDQEHTLYRFDPLDVQIRWHKNIDAIKWICHQTGTKIWVMEEPPNDKLYENFYKNYRIWGSQKTARDLMHPGTQWNNNLVQDFKKIVNDNLEK